MVRTYTYTRAETIEPENNNKVVSSLIPPTRDEVIAQLEKHFSEHQKDIVTSEDISELADRISAEFDYLRDKPYGGFAKYEPEKPYLSIRMYDNEYIMYDRERYPGDYSPLVSFAIFCSEITFKVTVVTNTKQINLAYVSKERIF